MKKKVTYVITKSNWGGAQRYVFDLATHLPAERFEVSVILGGSGPLKQKLDASGIPTVSIPFLQRDISLLKEGKSFFFLYRLFRETKPDVVHLNSSKAGGIGALAARSASWRSRHPINIIFTVHGLPEDEPRGALARLLIKIATRMTFVLCDKVITVSKENQQRVRGSVLIYNGIGPISFGTGEKIRSAFPAGATITGTIGELTKNKNQITLIEQAKSNLSMYVAIVGEGELHVYLEQKIKEYGLSERVKLLGFVPANEALKGFDRFALPSLKEGLPYVLLEAREAGLPIVANRVGGVAEALDKPLSEFSLDRMVEKTTALY